MHRSRKENGDPDESRTRVTAVKGPCLNHLTTGPCLMLSHQRKKDGIFPTPGSGNWIRTSDTPGMNRMLYQLSYAAVKASIIIKIKGNFVKLFFVITEIKYGKIYEKYK